MDFGFTDLSVSLNTSNTINDYSVKMLAKTMDVNEQMGQNLVNMIDSAAMERSVNPSVGANFDMTV
ncbi:MAG: YjfB family protein [Lachnospiraceae bacterium]|nr:YjfB family protein [Lachnospiraceae bacterium]